MSEQAKATKTETTVNDLAQIREACEKATPGPWYPTDDLDSSDSDSAVGVARGDPDSDDWAMVVTTPGSASYDCGADTNKLADADFIANARSWVPALVGELDAARTELAERDAWIVEALAWLSAMAPGLGPSASFLEAGYAFRANRRVG